MIAQHRIAPVPHTQLQDLRICIKGAGDLASGVAIRLHAAGLRRILMLETEAPLAVRRSVAFSEAVYCQEKIVEGVLAQLVERAEQIEPLWQAGRIAVMVDPQWRMVQRAGCDVLIDAIIAKRNLGSRLCDAPLVIGLGPGFTAREDVHCVVETQRGHQLGRAIHSGQALPNTGIPGVIAGYGIQRLLRASCFGSFTTALEIGERVQAGQCVGQVGESPVTAHIDGVLRGLLRSGTRVEPGTKLGDIDPRGELSACRLVSDKARAIGGGVLEAILDAFISGHLSPATTTARTDQAPEPSKLGQS